MGKIYSDDLRERVIKAVEEGQSARSAAKRFGISPNGAIKTVRRWRETGSYALPPRKGGRRSALDEHKDYLIGLIREKPDMTLQEISNNLRRYKSFAPSISSVWRFFDRHGFSYKKKPVRNRTRQAGRQGGEGYMAKKSGKT